MRLLIVSCCILTAVPMCANGQNARNNAELTTSAAFLTQLEDTSTLQSTDVTDELSRSLLPFKRFKRLRYSTIRSYHSRTLTQFKKLYPQKLFSIDVERHIHPYSGLLNIENPELHAVPYMLITPETFSDSGLRFETLQTTYKRAVIHGLRVTATVKEIFQQLPTNSLFMPYVPDVNARVLGFTHAQLILPLSQNIEAANVFDYNGLQKWSRHSRYAQHDQTKRPIQLTNWSHAAGDKYAVSAHPDFALESMDRNKKIVMTFFLWNRSTKRALGKEKIPGLPDFIFQIVQLPK